MNKHLRRLIIGGAAVAAPALINEIISLRRTPVADKMGGEALDYPWTRGDVRFHVAGRGEPMLLVHGIYPGASMAEWDNCFHEMAKGFRVFAVDLPGFGFSEKPAAEYSGGTFVRFIEDFCQHVVQDPPHVVATSLSAAFCVAAAHGKLRAKSLSLICPNGISLQRAMPSRLDNALYRMMSVPVLGTSLFNRMTSTAAIRDYLRKRVYANPARADEATVRRYHSLAHAPGAQWPLFAFFSGRLNLEISYAFSRLEMPIHLFWGRQAKIDPVSDSEEFLQRNPRAKLTVFERSAMLPQEEEPTTFVNALRAAVGAEQDMKVAA